MRKNRPSPYTIETLCKCGCGQIILNPDNHYRYRKFIWMHTNSNGTHPRLGTKEDRVHKEKRLSSMAKAFRKSPTILELQLYKFLGEQKVDFRRQKRIQGSIPDAYVPADKLCIFADGRYWHERPDVHSRDNRITGELISSGYKVIRLKSFDLGYNLDLRLLKEYYNSGAKP